MNKLDGCNNLSFAIVNSGDNGDIYFHQRLFIGYFVSIHHNEQ